MGKWSIIRLIIILCLEILKGKGGNKQEMEKFKKLKVRLGLFLIIFLGLGIVTTITSYANDDVDQEQSVEVGPVINEESTEVDEGQQDDIMIEEDENNQEVEVEEVKEDNSEDLLDESVSTSESNELEAVIQTNLNQSLFATSASNVKPQIDFTYLGITPINPMQGQEFTVRYKLTPNPFQHNISKPKEIVLVLDGSGSMSGTKLTNLKKAAKEFINRLKDVDNLKVGIVVFSSEATINPISVKNQNKDSQSLDSWNSHSIPAYTSLTGEYLLDVTDKRLITMIDNIKALGGTNTGEGLRKGEYLLKQGDSAANKTLILMSDGLPTFYSVKDRGNSHYTEINNTNPNYRGNGQSGSGDKDNINKSTNYAKEIGNIIRSSSYNIFSIGYALGNSNSTANQKLQEIHTSMGGAVTGDNSTFFASDEGAIDAVFEKIAEQLIKNYSFNDAQLNLQLADSVTLLEETTIVNGIKIDPIVYELGDNNWYHAPEQFIEFKIKVDTVGEIEIFNPNTNLTYTDIYGNKQSISIESPKITIAPFDVDASNKLQLDFQSLSNGYLIGDTAIARVTAIRPNVTNINFNKLNFTVSLIPSNLQLVGGNTTLNFGTVTETTSLDYHFIINNDSDITYENLKQYKLDGAYNYEIKQGNSSKDEIGSDSTTVTVKRGQIRVKVIDESGNNISQLSTVSMKDSNYQGIYQDGYIVFDTIPSGNYELVLQQLPEGLQISEDKRNAKVMINFDRNIGEYTFQVQGSYEEEPYPEIMANLSSDSLVSTYNGQEVDVIYTITGESFNAYPENTENSLIEEAVIILDLTAEMYEQTKWNAIRSSITSEFIDNQNLIDNNFKLSIIGYNSQVIIPTWSNFEKLFDLSNNEDRELIRGLINTPNIYADANEHVRNIDTALLKANDILSQSQNENQAIIIISNDNVSYNPENINIISQKNYKVISFMLGDSRNNQGTQTLKELQNVLGDPSDYIEVENPSKDNWQDYSNFDAQLSLIRENLLKKTLSKIVVNTQLNFDLGDNIFPISGFVGNDETRYQVDVPVTYNPITKNEDGTYRYEAAPFDVSFKIKVDTDELGEITFANKDDVEFTNLIYTDFNNKEVKKLIDTPIIEVVDNPVIVYDNNSINILEIQPADSFTLTGISVLNKIKTGTESFEMTVDNVKYPVTITRMSMPEFIGKSEKIDGKYDVIVLGRYNDSSITSSTDELNQYRYRDYYYDRGNNNEENDITMRKANELIDFMSKNQLVYIDSNIINNNQNSNYDYINTNIYKVFSNVNNTSQKNVNKTLTTSKERNENSVTLETIIRQYISLGVKEKGFSLSALDPVPNDITTSDLNAVDGKASNRNRYLDLTIQNADNSRENVTLNLYLDLNGDGLYSEDELAVTRMQLSLPLENYKLDFSVHPDFIGLLEWKLEVVREDVNQTKTYLTGSNFFHRLTEEKKKINVLQITNQSNYASVDSSGGNNYSVLNLKTNQRFNDLLQTPTLKDYEITIDIVYFWDYIKYLKTDDSWLSEEQVKMKQLNGYYDMVIAGFQDSYGNGTFTNTDSKLLVDKMTSFVQTGQGIMLTHDTIDWNHGTMFNTFRVYSGQSRYPTYTNGQLVTNLDGTAAIYETNIRGTNSNGMVPWQRGLSFNASMATSVYETNSALITQYPYKLTDDDQLLEIRRTHSQYYQLNLEDEEVIPWYTMWTNRTTGNYGGGYGNLTASQVNPYDVRNNYYTYSKGNITFSGTGEETREYIHYPDSELKLFVNTIIKAERGANHRPTVEVQNLENNQQVARAQSKIEFNVIPRDIDLDLMDVTVEVKACRNNKCDMSLGDNLLFEDKKDNESFKVTLDKNTLSGYASIANSNYTQLQVTVYAVDANGAKSEEVVRILDIVDINLLNVGLSTPDQVSTFLVGDSVELLAVFEKEPSYTENYTELNYTLKNLPSYLMLNGSLSQNLGNLTSLSNVATYNLKIGSSNQFLVSDPTRVTISGDSRYCINTCNQTIEGTQSLDLSIKKGQVRVKLISEEFNDVLQQTLITVRNQNGVEYSITPNSAGEFILDNVPTGTYTLTVNVPEVLRDFDVIQKNGDNLQVVDLTKGVTFDINYENNVFEVNYEFFEPQTEILHGLYGGLNGDKTAVDIIESLGDSMHTFIGKTNINFAGVFTYKSPLQEIVLEVDSAFNIATKDIKVYQVIEEDEQISLAPIDNVGIHFSKQNTVDQIKLNLSSTVSTNSKILILYKALAPDMKDSIFENRLSVGANTKLVEIKTIKQIDENGNSNLPNLF